MKREQIIYVTGASGWVGRQVCTRLKEAGLRVVAIGRKQQEGPWDHFLKADLSRDDGTPDETSLSAIPGAYAAQAIVHCAGRVPQLNRETRDERVFFSVNVDGTRRIVDWAQKIGVPRILHLSSIAFYSWDRMPVTETGTIDAKTTYAKSKQEGEKIILSSGMDYRIVRLVPIFGKGDKANFSKLAKALKRRRFVLPGSGDARKSLISVEEASDSIVRYLLMENPRHSVINLGLKDAPTLKEICEAFHEVCGFPMPVSCPKGIMKGLGLLGDFFSCLNPGFPLTSNTVVKLTRSTWVDCSKACEMLDLRADFRTSLRESVDYYRSL